MPEVAASCQYSCEISGLASLQSAQAAAERAIEKRSILALTARESLAFAEAILNPNKTIAQGFTGWRFEMKNGDEFEGFVTQEAADRVTIRNIAAQEIFIKAQEVSRRTRLEKSLMPEGLASTLTVREFAGLLDYLEGLSAAKP